jgi:selenoprotein W-related protein
LAAALLNQFKQKIKGLTLQPSQGGCFEVTFDSELVYSKLKTGQFPDENAIAGELRSRV